MINAPKTINGIAEDIGAIAEFAKKEVKNIPNDEDRTRQPNILRGIFLVFKTKKYINKQIK